MGSRRVIECGRILALCKPDRPACGDSRLETGMNIIHAPNIG